MLIILLRTLPPFGTAHTFCASRDIQVSKAICPLTQNIFSLFMTMWKKQILARAIRIQKENWG